MENYDWEKIFLRKLTMTNTLWNVGGKGVGGRVKKRIMRRKEAGERYVIR